MDQKKVAAFLIDADPEECMKFRQEGDGMVVIGPDGKKYKFSAEQLEKGEIAMQQKQTLAEAAAEGRTATTHEEEQSPKPRRTTTKRKPATRKKTTSTPSKKETGTKE